MLNQELYAPSYEKAIEMTKDAAESNDVANPGMKLVRTSVILSMVQSMDLLNRLMLEELTGVDVSSSEALYEYLTKSINLTEDKAMKFSVALIVQNGDEGLIMDAMNQSMGGL